MDPDHAMARGRTAGHPRREETTVRIVGHPPVQHFSWLDKGPDDRVRIVSHPLGVEVAVRIDGPGANYLRGFTASGGFLRDRGPW